MKNSINHISGEYLSPLRYPGGKRRLAPYVAATIDRNFDANTRVVLVEPFAGGAGASLALLTANIVDRIVINDLDRAIYAFWKTAVYDSPYLIDKIRHVDVTMGEWHNQRSIYLDPQSTDRQLAFATLFLNRTNRSGIIGARPIGGMEQTGLWKIGARFTKSTIIKRLANIEQLKDRIHVSNLDGIDLLKRIEKKKTADCHFIFLDPPYCQQGSSLYLNHYESADHETLATYLASSTLKWIMTYDDVPYIRRLYSSMHKSKMSVNHSAHKCKTGQEVIIFCNSLVRAYM